MAIRIHRTAEATSRGQKLKKNFTWLRAQKYLWEMAALKQRCYELSNEGDQAPKMTLPCAKS